MHLYQPIFAGKPVAEAKKALVMVHGRGSNARSILSLADQLAVDNFALVAPQATNNTWYPLPFLAPREHNQPWLNSALDVLARVAWDLEHAGIDVANIHWLGFSQGACLTLEFVASYGRTFGGVFGLSGGLIGATVEAERYTTRLTGMPVILGCSDVDSHIPIQRVIETDQVFKTLGCQVQTTIYPQTGHVINEDEIEQINGVLEDSRKRNKE